MRTIRISRSDAESIVDLIDGYKAHDFDLSEFAADLREEFGMCTREQEQQARGHSLRRTCDSCRHWGTSEAQEWHGDADRPGRKFCGCPKITDGAIWNESEFTPDMASAVDCEHYHAFLQTGPKFGCVHWEAMP